MDDGAREVATTISGYVAKKLLKRSKCESCKLALTTRQVDLDNDSYLKILSRGGLFTPSRLLVDYVCSSFAFLDFLEDDLITFDMPVAKAANYILKRYGSSPNFACETHEEWGFKFASKIIINIFFNNKQKIAKDSVRKESVNDFKTRQRAKK